MARVSALHVFIGFGGTVFLFVLHGHVLMLCR